MQSILCAVKYEYIPCTGDAASKDCCTLAVEQAHLCEVGEPCLCGADEGDCDDDSECEEGLICGSDNCPEDSGFHDTHDCCYDPFAAVCDGGDSCCTSDYPCGEEEGDCDEDSDCEGDLLCGSDNCPAGETFETDDDCCYDPFAVTCDGGDSCCTSDYPCGEEEGDCDEDSECEEGLKCGRNNCPDEETFESGDDCCYEPDMSNRESCGLTCVCRMF